jgi:acetyl esterase
MSMIGKIYLLKGKPVTVLVRWKGKGPRNVLIQGQDGSKVVRPFRGLRKVR